MNFNRYKKPYLLCILLIILFAFVVIFNHKETKELYLHNTNPEIAGSTQQVTSQPENSKPTPPQEESVESQPIPPSSSSSSSKPTPPPVPSPPKTVFSTKKVVGYYNGWSSYQGFTPHNIKTSKLTHLHYAFAKIADDLTIALADPVNDKNNFKMLKQIKAENPHLKTLISIGGWDYSVYFSDVASTQETRQIFAKSCVDFIKTYGFDGIDIDWEYPVSGGIKENHHRPEDKLNFTLLLQEIRNQLNAQSGIDGKKYLLSVAVSPGAEYLQKVEINKIEAVVDYLFLMAYDIHGSWDSFADFNAPLQIPYEKSPHPTTSVEHAVQTYLNAGIPRANLVLGMPFYGYAYQVFSSENNGLYAPFQTAKSVGYDTVMKNYANNSVYQQFYHEVAQTPYLFGENTFVSFENEKSIASKAMLAKKYNLGGIGAWEISHDKNGILLKTAYDAFM